MKKHDLVELAGRNLREARLRNGLTITGISVGVASLVAMLSLGVGLQQLANKRLARSGLFDVIYVTSLHDYRDADPDERKVDLRKARQLDEAARNDLQGIPNVLEVEPEVRFMGEVHFGPTTHAAFVAGVPSSSRDDESFEGMKGQFFSSPHAQEAIVQLEFAKDLQPSDPNSVIGQELSLRYAERRELTVSPSKVPESTAPGAKIKRQGAYARNFGSDPGPDSEADADSGEGSGFSVVRKVQKLKIVGIVEEEPFGGMRSISRARVFIPIALAGDLNMMQYSDLRGITGDASGRKTYLALVARVASAGRVQDVQTAIKNMGFRTYSMMDATKGLRRFFAILDIFLGIFGSLALAVASLAIINTLIMAVMERRREIGIMKAIGASDADIKLLFFAEAGAMGLVGGILGVVLGFLIGRVINFGVNVWLHYRQLPSENIWSSPLWLVGAAIAFSVFVSLVAGLYPAARASKLDPVQALRYE